jgi:hypothetical protein
MWKPLAVIVPLLALSAAAQPSSSAAEENAPPLPVHIVYRVKQEGGGLGVMVDEAVVFHQVDKSTGPIWVVERRRRDQKLSKITYRYEWIDGRTCPALREVIAAIGKLPPTPFAGAQTQPDGWVSDTPYVTLMGPPRFGRMGDFMLQRDLKGPVSQWWWDSEKKLESCWSAKQPYIPGAYDLRPRLTTVQGEAEIMRPY